MQPIDRTRMLIADHIVRTPCTEFDNIVLKREDLQTSGSFKWRGVQAQLRTGVAHSSGIVCVSTGNTGKAVALAASRLGVSAHVFCTNVPASGKLRYIREHGATIHIEGATFSQTSSAAATFAADNSMVFCSPGSNWPFVRGVGAIVSEILEDRPDVRVVYAPIGGGGLVSGLGMDLRERSRPRPGLIGVQATNSPYVYDLFYGNEAETIESATIAECLAGDLEQDAIILSVAHDVLDAVVLLSEGQMRAGVRQLAERGINVEPGAAAAFAAAKTSVGLVDRPGSVCAIISGGSDIPEPMADLSRGEKL